MGRPLKVKGRRLVIESLVCYPSSQSEYYYQHEVLIIGRHNYAQGYNVVRTFKLV